MRYREIASTLPAIAATSAAVTVSVPMPGEWVASAEDGNVYFKHTQDSAFGSAGYAVEADVIFRDSKIMLVQPPEQSRVLFYVPQGATLRLSQLRKE